MGVEKNVLFSAKSIICYLQLSSFHGNRSADIFLLTHGFGRPAILYLEYLYGTTTNKPEAVDGLGRNIVV